MDRQQRKRRRQRDGFEKGEIFLHRGEQTLTEISSARDAGDGQMLAVVHESARQFDPPLERPFKGRAVIRVGRKKNRLLFGTDSKVGGGEKFRLSRVDAEGFDLGKIVLNAVFDRSWSEMDDDRMRDPFLQFFPFWPEAARDVRAVKSFDRHTGFPSQGSLPSPGDLGGRISRAGFWRKADHFQSGHRFPKSTLGFWTKDTERKPRPCQRTDRRDGETRFVPVFRCRHQHIAAIITHAESLTESRPAETAKSNRFIILPCERRFGFRFREDIERAVLRAPFFDVGPVEGEALDLDHCDGIGEILWTFGSFAPAKF